MSDNPPPVTIRSARHVSDIHRLFLHATPAAIIKLPAGWQDVACPRKTWRRPRSFSSMPRPGRRTVHSTSAIFIVRTPLPDTVSNGCIRRVHQHMHLNNSRQVGDAKDIFCPYRCSRLVEVDHLRLTLKAARRHGQISDAGREPNAADRLGDCVQVPPDQSAKDEPQQRHGNVD